MVILRACTPFRRKVATHRRLATRVREIFIDNLLVRIHYIIVMMRWTGLAPWEFLNSPFQVALHLPSTRLYDAC